jgi:hypothetical protein
MEMSQGHSLCSSLKQIKMLFFFIYKIGEQDGGTGLAWGVRVGTSRMEEEVGKDKGG